MILHMQIRVSEHKPRPSFKCVLCSFACNQDDFLFRLEPSNYFVGGDWPYEISGFFLALKKASSLRTFEGKRQSSFSGRTLLTLSINKDIFSYMNPMNHDSRKTAKGLFNHSISRGRSSHDLSLFVASATQNVCFSDKWILKYSSGIRWADGFVHKQINRGCFGMIWNLSGSIHQTLSPCFKLVEPVRPSFNMSGNFLVPSLQAVQLSVGINRIQAHEIVPLVLCLKYTDYFVNLHCFCGCQWQ